MSKSRQALLFAVILTLAASARLHAQNAPELNPSTLPVDGKDAEHFVPHGWKIAAAVTGDLNGDGRVDRVIQLVPKDYDSEGVVAAPESQAALILLSTDEGKLRRAVVSTKLLVTMAPQYSLEMSIKNGVLVVNQNYGMTDVVDVTDRFRYDAKSGRFVLIGKDVFNYHRPQGPDWPGVRVSENYLTGVRLTQTDHWLKNGTNKPTTQREQIVRSQLFIEDVDENP